MIAKIIPFNKLNKCQDAHNDSKSMYLHNKPRQNERLTSFKSLAHKAGGH